MQYQEKLHTKTLKGTYNLNHTCAGHRCAGCDCCVKKTL